MKAISFLSLAHTHTQRTPKQILIGSADLSLTFPKIVQIFLRPIWHLSLKQKSAKNILS